MNSLRTLIALVATLALGRLEVGADDWPGWGGTEFGRNMYSPAKGLPEKFAPGKAKPGTEEIDLATTRNVKWVAKLGSQSYGNPVIAGGHVFAGTNNEMPRDPRHRGDRSILACFEEQTGRFLWQLVVPKLKAGKVSDWEGLGLLASPCVQGNRLWVVTSRGEVLCLDTAGMANGNDGPYREEAAYQVQDTDQSPIEPGPQDADIIWRYDMIEELGVFPHNASNCSVLVLGDTVFVGTSNGQDWTHANIPSPHSPSLIALDKHTGKLVGEDDCGIGPRIFHGQWSSPSAGQVNGKWQVYLGGGDGVLYALDPTPVRDGEVNHLKQAWWYDCVPSDYKIKDGKPIPYPASDGPSEINATPVFYKNRVYVAIGQDPEHGEGLGHLVCVDATQVGDIGKAGNIWSFKGIKRSLSTVSIDPSTGLLFIGDFSGFVYGLEAETGKLLWVHDLKAHMWGSTLVADGKVYAGDEDGDFTVLAAAREKKVLSEVNLGAPIYSTPVVANGVLYLGTQTHLYALVQAGLTPLDRDRPATAPAAPSKP